MIFILAIMYLGRIYAFSPAQIGASIAIFMLPFAALSYPFGRLAERRSQVALLCGGSALYGVGTAFVGFMAPPGLFGLMFAIGICAAVMFVPSMLMTVRLAPGAIRATALGAFNSAGSLGFIVGPSPEAPSASWSPRAQTGSRAIARPS